MKASVRYEACEWEVIFFDEPWFWECTHPETVEEDVESFDGEEVYAITRCADKDCLMVLS